MGAARAPVSEEEVVDLATVSREVLRLLAYDTASGEVVRVAGVTGGGTVRVPAPGDLD
jgi:hypothetical protein